MKKVIGHALVTLSKIANKCKSTYLYSLVNARGGGFIGANTVLIFPDNVFLGTRSYINGGMIAACPDAKIVIGNDCMISYAVHIRADMHCHDLREGSAPMIEQGHTSADIILGDNVWVGYGAQVLSGVKVGSNCVIAAGAVVTKDVPDGSVVAGVPAKIVKKFATMSPIPEGRTHE